MSGIGGMSVLELMQLLWRRKATLLLSAITVGGLALAFTSSLPARFSAEGLLLVEIREPLIPELMTQTAASNAGASTPQPRTEASILRSRSLAEAVVRDLDLTTHAEFDVDAPPAGWADRLRAWVARVPEMLGLRAAPGASATTSADKKVEYAVRSLQQSLDIALDNYNRVVRIGFTARTPEIAAAIANGTMDRYIANEVAAKRDITVQAHRWLTERTLALRDDVEAADRRVQDYREEHALLSTQAGSLTSVQLASEQGQLSQARQDAARLRAAYETAARAAATRGGGSAGAQEALASPLIQRLRERETEIVARLGSISERLGARHPDVVAADRELRDVRRQTELETSRLVDSLRRDMTIAEGRARDLEQRVQASENDARRAAVAEVTLQQLIHDADAKRQVYHAFLTRVDQTQLASAQFPPARIVSRADPPANRSGPPRALATIFGSFAGLFLGAGLVLGRQITRGRVGSAAELMAITQAPNLGSLPRIAGKWRSGTPALGHQRTGALSRDNAGALSSDKAGALSRDKAGALSRDRGRALSRDQRGMAETLRTLRISLQTMAASSNSVTALVTSPSSGDGKTMVAASLARVCASDGMRVLLVETDLRRPRLAAALDARPRFSIEALLAGRAAFNDAVHVDERTGLHCLLAAGDSDNPQALLESQRFQGLMIQARRNYQLVVLDSPPVLRVADPVLVSAHSDVVLLVCAWERTLRAEVTEAIRRFPESRRARIATVLNWVRPGRLDPQGYSEGYARKPALQPRRLPSPANGPANEPANGPAQAGGQRVA